MNELVGAESFRETVLRFPGIRKDIEFWDNEWNVIPDWKNSNESVQARYVPRYYLEAKAHGVRGFVWEFIPGTDGSDISCEVLQDRDPVVPEEYTHGQFRQYCFRNRISAKPIYAIWLAVNASLGDHFKPVTAEIIIPDRQIQNPVVIDVRTGRITPTT